ncbi:MAG: hypothetical protein HKN51_13245 [Saprospiraceae bacterium]|nr:hypothetical protein [Saprospiraceae bacterium]
MISCIQLSYAQCDTDCELQCIGQINVSLDQTCTTNITPAMGGVNIEPQCNSNYTVSLYDDYGLPISGTELGIEYNGKLLSYKITDINCGNSCWGNLLVEYKYPPQIECPDDLTVACGVVDLLDVPPATGGCTDYEVLLFSQEKNSISCDPNFSSSIIRTYRATDEFGNSSTCSHTIFIERIDINNIIFPDFTTISCNDPLMRYDANGFPIPWINIPLSGSGSGQGVPIICDPYVDNGLYCPTENDFSGVPLIPAGGAILIKESDDPFNPGYTVENVDDSNNAALCNAYLSYTDIEIPHLTCKRKILRTWEVREWWCTSEYTNGSLQIIQIIDDKAPTFVCPNDRTVSTDYECGGHVYLPPIEEVFDECASNINYRVDYYGGVLNTNGGYVDLSLGHNTLTYIVSDDCNNQSTCNVSITVADATEPVAICEQYKVISISQSSETIVYADPFDNGSWDECGIERFEVRRMDSLCVAADTLFGESITFCCSDVNREVMVVFRVVDWSGNFNDCMVTVDVQDKIAPHITCPVDVTIDCDDGYDIENLGLTFGDATVTDNCSETQVIHERSVVDVTQCGVGDITRFFEILDEDSTVISHCKQFIKVSNNTVFELTNIQWPLDYSIPDGCRTSDLEPEDLPDLYNYPTFPFQEPCTLLGYNYEDKMFTSPGGCVRIERYWTVINWCGNGENGFDQYTSPDPQIIDIINTISPVIEPADSLFFESINITCLGDTVEVMRNAMDDCDFLSWHYLIRDSRDTVIYEGFSNAFRHLLPIGEYHIEWHVEDGCGNSASDIQFASMLNVKAPTPVCINGLSVNLVGMDLDSDGVVDAEMVEIWASDFDSGSSHSCGNPIVLSLSSDTTHKSTFFDCEDVGLKEVQLWATDALTGNQDFCRTFIEILDNNNYDICNDSIQQMSVIGDIFDEQSRTIEGVEVTLNDASIMEMTNEEGEYAFNHMPSGGTYDVKPFKDDDYLNGVSTLDLIYIQRHILGLERITSPYKLIAADINNNQDISSTDLIELRKLILGIEDEFPSNNSWRFVDADFNFIDSSDPWINPIPESYYIPELNQSMDIDFVGVKIGDVNNSVITANAVEGSLDQRSFDIINIESVVNEGASIIEFYVDELDNIDGMQGTITFDPNEISINDGISGQFNISDENLNLSYTDDGLITFSISENVPVSVTAREPLFALEYEKKSNVNNVEISLNSELTNAEIYVEGKPYDLNMIGKFENQYDNQLKAYPNPWIENTMISFESKEEGTINIAFYDITGRLLLEENKRCNIGINQYQVLRSQIDSKGVIYAKITSSHLKAELKMILL